MARRPGSPKVTDSYDNSSTSPTKLQDRRRRRRSTGSGQLQAPEGLPRSRTSPTTTASRSRRMTYMFTNTEPDRRADRRRQAAGRHGRGQLDRARPRAEHESHRNWKGSSRARASRLSTAPTSSASAPRAGQHGVDHQGQVRLPPLRVPGSRPPQLRRRRRRPARRATCTGTGRPGRDAAPSWWRRAAAASSGRPTRSGAGNYIVIDGKRTSHDWMYTHLKKPSHLHKGAAGPHRPEDRRRRRRPATPPAATCTSRSGRRPGWYEGGHFLKCDHQAPQAVGSLELAVPAASAGEAP